MAKERTLDARGLTPEEAQAALDNALQHKRMSLEDRKKEIQDVDAEIVNICCKDLEFTELIVKGIAERHPDLLKKYMTS